MSILNLLIALFAILAAFLAAIWWVRHTRRGLDWVIFAIPLAFGVSYLSSFMYRVPDYEAGCQGLCPGWWGYPLATHVSEGIGAPKFEPSGFILNAGIYYTAILIFSAIIMLWAEWLRWRERNRRWRLAFILFAVVLPLAVIPTLFPPRQPQLAVFYERMAINAAQAWRWQLRSSRFSQRRLVIEDVRLHPDGQRYRACFRAYTWFYIPLNKVYIDLDPSGVRATGGGVIPLDASCWVQP